MKNTQRKTAKKRSARGALVIIGGAEDREGECTILRAFLDLAGGNNARIAVIAVASANPTLVGSTYVQIAKRWGAKDAILLNLDSHDEVNSAQTIQWIKQATGVFFTGGDQVRITRVLGGTALDRLLAQRHHDGLVIGGTSAGAAIMSSIMITGGLGMGALRTDNVQLGTGMEFLPGVIIDQHFQQRWRFKRLLAAIAQHPHQLGIGIDENTAIIVRERMFDVLGAGSVTVIDGKRMTYVNQRKTGSNELLALCGATIHVLTEPMGYDMKNRFPLPHRRSTNETQSTPRSSARHRRA